ncbi:MAG: membrane protein insertase YidC [Parvularculales bacterium]
MDDSRNFIVAAVLCMLVLVGWQYFVAGPQMEAERARQEAVQAQRDSDESKEADRVPQVSDVTPRTGPIGTPGVTRAEVLSAGGQRLKIITPDIQGSIALKGGRFDDLTLNRYRETVAPTSPDIVLLSPGGVHHTYFAEFGWTAAETARSNLPGPETIWSVSSDAALTPETPVTLSWDNGKGLLFKRIIMVDEHYMFTIKQSVENNTGGEVTLFPYGRISRHGAPPTTGFWILHEGLIGVFDGAGLQEIDYDDLHDTSPQSHRSMGGWLGITDKYWSAVLVPEQTASFRGSFTGPVNNDNIYQADYLRDAVTIRSNNTAIVTNYLFAGAKEVSVIDEYETRLGILNFDLLIDWGWFYFLTKPLFQALDFLYRLAGNFGIAILLVTIAIKLVFFPLANRSYVAMSRMKKLQPEMMRLREVYQDDKMQQQQKLMELYRKEKVNPAAGCLPILIQIPVFFALYKVLFVTIEMRHAPFFGWVHDLSAPDPTTIFNLFGLIPWTPPGFLIIGVWPLIMGVTMMIQMKMNPAPPDPIQQKIFTWMPVFFVFLLASFPAGLVIYWAWNNLLSIIQQGVIMRRQGVPIELFDNLRPSWMTETKSDSAGSESKPDDGRQ